MGRKHTEICSVIGCERPFYGKGLCRSHYERARTGKDMRSLIGQTEIDLFFEAVFASEPTDDCILWRFAVGSKGYGVYRKSSAHRYVCQRIHGEAPEGKPYVAHSCHVRLCINPHHLRWASTSENEHDKIEAGTFFKRWKKVSDEDVRFIRKAYGALNSSELAKVVGTSRGNAWRIATCKSRLDPSLL